TPDVFREAIRAAKDSAQPINLLVKDLTYYQTHAVDYHGGLRYPHLERVAGTTDYLDRIIAPLK
ncbi:MAG TPA: peptidase M61, partial [Gammaproteobacteria bacterium]|nr:peptidase M61 [Gammaproteobacteria bacterium]